MSAFSNPFDPKVHLGPSCGCGEHRSPAKHDAAQTRSNNDLPDAAIDCYMEISREPTFQCDRVHVVMSGTCPPCRTC